MLMSGGVVGDKDGEGGAEWAPATPLDRSI
jgi:hypothetical protein